MVLHNFGKINQLWSGTNQKNDFLIRWYRLSPITGVKYYKTQKGIKMS